MTDYNLFSIPRNTKKEKRPFSKDQKDFNKKFSKKKVKIENVLVFKNFKLSGKVLLV